MVDQIVREESYKRVGVRRKVVSDVAAVKGEVMRKDSPWTVDIGGCKGGRYKLEMNV